MIDRTVTKEGFETIAKIADRCLTYGARKRSKIDIIMDIEAVHCNGNPLRLNDLLDAPNFDFAHDVFGIQQHLDRRTGKLQNCFVPRYSARTN